MANKDTLLHWLMNAHAMEVGIAQALEQHLNDARNEAELAQKIQEHLAQTQLHASAMEKAVTRLGGGISGVKSGLAGVLGTVQGVADGLASDWMVKNAIAEYSAEYFEIATYKAIIAAAEEAGDQETVNVCLDIIKEEEAMAAWLESELPELVAEFMRREKTA
jgi:ferritin-like metal-binding protein YciE